MSETHEHDSTRHTEEGAMTTEQPAEAFAGHAILELLGHRRRAGYVTEQQLAGVTLLRVDIPGRDGGTVSEFYNPASLYALQPVSEAVARAVAARNQPAPVQLWEFPPAPRAEPHALPAHEADDEDYYDPGDDDEDEVGL